MVLLWIYISLVDQIKEKLSDTQRFSCLVTIYEKTYLKCEDVWMEIEIQCYHLGQVS